MISYGLNTIFIENIILFSILLLFTLMIIATIYDLKFKIIPNKITISMITSGLIINLFISIISNNYFIIISMIILTILVFLITYLLWRLKVWGGGDVKLITGISSLLPFHPNVILNQYFTLNKTVFDIFHISFIENILIEITNINIPLMSFYPFLFTIILNSILVSFPFLIIFVTFNYIKNIYFNNNMSNNYNDSNSFYNYNIKAIKDIKSIKDFNKELIFRYIKNIKDIKSIKDFNKELIFRYIKNIKDIKSIKNFNKKLIFRYKNFNFKKRIMILVIYIIFLIIFKDFSSSYQILNIKSMFSIIAYGIILTFLSPLFILLIKKFRIIVKKELKNIFIYLN